MFIIKPLITFKSYLNRINPFPLHIKTIPRECPEQWKLIVQCQPSEMFHKTLFNKSCDIPWMYSIVILTPIQILVP